MIVEVDGQRFDVPDDATPEELDALSAPTAPKTSRLAATGRGALQGATLGLSDELGGMARAGLRAGAEVRTPGPLALAKLYPGVPYPEAASRWFNENRPDEMAARSAEVARANQAAQYAIERDKIRDANQKAREDRPGYYIGGEIAGGVVPALASAPVTGATTLGGRVLAGAASAAPMGAVYGLGTSEAADPAHQAFDAFVGGAGGAVAGGALPLAAAAIRPLAKKAADYFSKSSITQGRKFLTGNAAPMSTRKPLSDEAVHAAYDVGAVRPFSTVEKAAERLQGAREVAGEHYADIIAALESKGVTGPNAVLLARKLSQEADQIATQSLGSPVPGMFRSAADELVTKVPNTPFAPRRLGLQQAENMKRTLQQGARSEYVKEGPQSLSGEGKTRLASFIRQAIEDEVAAQSAKAPAEAAAFEPVKKQVGALIEASTAADRAAARAANRQTHGLGSKVMAAGALSTGNVPAAVATLYGTTALRNRGPATAGSLFRALSRASGAVADVAPQTVSRTARVASPTIADEVSGLIAYLRRFRPELVPAAADEEQ